MYSNFDLAREIENISNRVKEYVEQARSQTYERPREDAGAQTQSQQSTRPLTADFYQTAENFILEIDLPGLSKEDIAVRLISDLVLEVSGKREFADAANFRFIQQERWFGNFRRQFHFPTDAEIDPDGIQAAYREGVLKITVPKRRPEPERSIDIQ